MRILIVNNNTKRMEEIARLLAGHETFVVTADKLQKGKESGFDLVILTGSSDRPVHGNDPYFAPELALIRETQVPLIGICLGFELIAYAYGAPLLKLPEKTEGYRAIHSAGEERLLDGRTEFIVHEGHRWHVPELPPGFSGHALSETGWEIISHNERPLWGVQFHPEVHDEAHSDGRLLFEAILLRIRNASNTAAVFMKKK